MRNNLGVLLSQYPQLNISTALKAISLPALILLSVGAAHPAALYEQSGVVVIEAESFATQHLDDKRRWLRVDQHSVQSGQNSLLQDSDEPHLQDTSANAYIELLPDSRSNHFEPVIDGENFSDKPGTMAILSYPTYFETAGIYYVWARAYSTGSEDNGIHIGLNGQWPQTSSRLQLCANKHQWTWSSAQRTKQNHCGTPNSITINIPAAGVHNVMVSMREDGFELDKLLLTQDINYTPSGQDLPETVIHSAALSQKQILKKLIEYKRILYAYSDFSATSEIGFDNLKEAHALAINSSVLSEPNQFVYAKYEVHDKDTKSNSITLVTLTEIAGRSEYQIYINDKKIAQFINPQTTQDFQEHYFTVNNITLKKGDIIRVGAKVATSTNTSENANTTYVGGHWRALVLGAKLSQ